MDWSQIFTIVASNMALFIWARSEARHDQQEIREIIRSIQEEIKDFHARLCVIEEKRGK
jgi:seryl-tRNA(Sec) selenium transferase